jgi:hypothetical protein
MFLIPAWLAQTAINPLEPSDFHQETGNITTSGTVSLAWGPDTHRFAVLFIPLATPRKVDEALVRLRRLADAVGVPDRLLVAPYLSPAAFQQLRADGVSGVDQSGNLMIERTGSWHLARTGAPNRFPARQGPVKRPFAGRSLFVPMLLLTKGRGTTQADLAKALRSLAPLDPVSPGSTSKVLAVLEEERLIQRSADRGPGKPAAAIEIPDPEALLDAIVAHAPAPRVIRRLRTQLNLDPRVGRQLNRNAATSATPTAVLDAVHWVPVPAASHVTTIWTRNVDALLGDLPHDPGSPAPDVELVETRDEFPFVGAVTTTAFRPPTMGAVAQYLQLRRGGGAEREAAAALRAVLLRPAS